MQIKRFNISKPTKYTTRNGEEKTRWNNVGTLTEFHKDDGTIGRKVEIPAIGLDANAFEVDDQPKNPNGTTAPKKSKATPEIDADDLPF